MKLLRVLAVLLAACLAASPALAQWQTSAHSVPVGRGAGGTGFASAPPGDTGQVLGSNGASANPSFQPLAALINAACSFAPTPCQWLFGYVMPQWFGATCTNAGDDGPAFNAAVAFSTPVVVQLSTGCVYRVVTPIVWNKFQVEVRGGGVSKSAIVFAPTANGALFTIGTGNLRLYQNVLHDFTMYSADTTFTKVALRVRDISESHFYNLSCHQTITGGRWSGGTGSTCLETNGRDTTTFQNLQLYADKPIVLNLNPNTYLSTDHFVFRDLDLVANGFPCVQANDGIVMTNTTFEGRQSWNLCTYGFLVQDATSAVNWNNLSFSNVRVEQSTGGPTAYSFFIAVNPANRLVGLVINNSTVDGMSRGVFIDHVQNATFQNTQFSCFGSSPVALDMATTNEMVRIVNSHFESACTLANSSGAPMTLKWSAGSLPSYSTSPIPPDAIYMNH